VLDDKVFATRVVEMTIRKALPIGLRAAASRNPKHAEALEAAAVRCEQEGTREAALDGERVARAAAAAAAYAAYAAAAAAAAASAASAAAYAAAAADAASAAYAAAYAAADAADAAAYAYADAAAAAAYADAAARRAAYKRMAEKLLELMSQAPVSA
jgi:hypothetical protein